MTNRKIIFWKRRDNNQILKGYELLPGEADLDYYANNGGLIYIWELFCNPSGNILDIFHNKSDNKLYVIVQSSGRVIYKIYDDQSGDFLGERASLRKASNIKLKKPDYLEFENQTNKFYVNIASPKYINNKLEYVTTNLVTFLNSHFQGYNVTPFSPNFPKFESSCYILDSPNISGLPYSFVNSFNLTLESDFQLTGKDIGNGITLDIIPDTGSPLIGSADQDATRDFLITKDLKSDSLFKAIYLDQEGNTVDNPSLDVGAINIDTVNQFYFEPPLSLSDFLFDSNNTQYVSSYVSFFFSQFGKEAMDLFQDEPSYQPQFSYVDVNDNPALYVSTRGTLGVKFDGLDDFFWIDTPDWAGDSLRVFSSFDAKLTNTNRQPIIETGNFQISLEGSETSKVYQSILTTSGDVEERDYFSVDTTGFESINTLSCQIDSTPQMRLNLAEVNFDSSYESISEPLTPSNTITVGKDADGNYFEGVMYELAFGNLPDSTTDQAEQKLIDFNHKYFNEPAS